MLELLEVHRMDWERAIATVKITFTIQWADLLGVTLLQELPTQLWWCTNHCQITTTSRINLTEHQPLKCKEWSPEKISLESVLWLLVRADEDRRWLLLELKTLMGTFQEARYKVPHSLRGQIPKLNRVNLTLLIKLMKILNKILRFLDLMSSLILSQLEGWVKGQKVIFQPRVRIKGLNRTTWDKVNKTILIYNKKLCLLSKK